MLSLLISALSSIIFGLLASNLARKKGRDPQFWMLMGFLFALFSIIILAFLEKKEPKLAMAHNPPSASTPFEILPPQEAPQEERVLWYYLDEEHEQVGPMSFSALKDAWHTSKLKNSSYLWNETMENWEKLSELPKILAKITFSESEGQS